METEAISLDIIRLLFAEHYIKNAWNTRGTSGRHCEEETQ
jgi:hypothetical protein